MNRTEELLDEIADYADRLAYSDTLADKGSMATAEALSELYEKREWVTEWLEQKPILKKKAYIGGRPPQPDSRNRFSQWQVWKQEQRERRSVQSRRTYQLLNAHEIRGCLNLVQTTSERAVRPLDWLRKNKYLDRLPEVEKRAVELAGSVNKVTSAHTRQALADWKKEVLGTKGVSKAVRSSKAERDRTNAELSVRKLWADGDDDAVRKFDAWYREFRKGASV